MERGKQLVEASIVGVDIGGTRLRVALADSRGRILRRRTALTVPSQGSKVLVDRLAELISDITTGVREQLLIGVGVPGPVNYRTGTATLFMPPHLPDWSELPILSILESRLLLPVKVGRDTSLAALGEHRFGAGKGISNLVYITISTGISSGVIIEGRLLAGESGLAGELGHCVVQSNGPLCSCGRRGCLVTVASGTAIAMKAQGALARGVKTKIASFATEMDITAAAVASAAQAGDEVAIEIMASASQALSVAISNVIHMLNPHRIIVGGGVSAAWELLVEPIRANLEGLVMARSFAQDVDIVPAGLGDDAGLLGAVALWL